MNDASPVRVRDIAGLESGVIVEDDVGIVVRDGTRLSARVFRPADAGECPVVLALTSYGKDLGPDRYPSVLDNAALPDFDMGTVEVSPWTTWEGPDPATWVPEGYAVVYVDVRGYFGSEGDASVLSAQDADDFHDVIEWAGAQAPLPPFELFRQVHPDPQAMRAFQPESFVRPALADVPALICATWSDQGLHTRGSFEGFKQTAAEQKWLFTHGRQKWAMFYGEEAFEYQLAFLDHFLKGLDNGWDARPAVRLEVREDRERYEVRFEDDWPIARTQYRELYLDAASGRLSHERPAASSVVEYEPLSGSATFTAMFDEDTELTGNMKLRLWVSTTEGADIDLFVGVRKLDVDGDEVHFFAKTGYTKGPVAMGWLRASERALDVERSTPWQPVLTHDAPQPLTPGEIVPVDVEILPSSTLFRAGESLQLVVRGADLLEHPALAHAYSRDVNRGVHAIHAGGEYDSHLLVPHVGS